MQRSTMLPGVELLLLFLLSTSLHAEISHLPMASNRIILDSTELLQNPLIQDAGVPAARATPLPPQKCPSLQRYRKMLKDFDDLEDLYVDVPVHIALAERQRKR